jgi:hypothetical protein
MSAFKMCPVLVRLFIWILFRTTQAVNFFNGKLGNCQFNTVLIKLYLFFLQRYPLKGGGEREREQGHFPPPPPKFLTFDVYI